MTAMFESLDAFRAHCGEPTMSLDRCPICSNSPTNTSRHVEDHDGSDDSPNPSPRLAEPAQ